MTTPPPMLATLENYLRLTTTRQQAITANMANVDTPGYHTHDINFESELNRAITNVSFHAEDGSEGLVMEPVVREVKGLMERPDGNDVSLDREGLLMSETQLQYQIGVQLVKHHFHGLLAAINGGS
jgi:flagellar basal-body rod protein FlgB